MPSGGEPPALDRPALDRIVALRIHPGLGIARLGNSPDGYFVGPEAPGHAVQPEGGYKDVAGKVKRQAARFRVFGFDAAGEAVAELNAGNADIVWTVHLANKKGAWYAFGKDISKRETVLRNLAVQPHLSPGERTDLIVDPGPRSVGGRGDQSPPFDGGRFLGEPITLGEVRTDADGHLLVLGGGGRSGSVPAAKPIQSSFNNDGWFDDTADGPVAASVTLPDGRTLEATPAWVVVAPPNFAPAITNLVTLYERVRETLGLTPCGDDGAVDYYRDVRPLLARLSLYSWVNRDALRGHGPGKPGDFLAPDADAWLTAEGPNALQRRRQIVSRLRLPPGVAPPETADEKAGDGEASYFYMPQLAGDGGDPVQGDSETWMTLLPSQYQALNRWAEGDFAVGAPEPARPFAGIPVAERPAALDRAALEPCVGAPFCPGIEMTYIAEQPETFQVLPAEAIRIGPQFGPGDVTRYMALPWQSDFHDCSDHWWPAQRPDDVLPEAVLNQVSASWGERPFATPAGGNQFVPAQIAGEETAAALVYRVPWSRGMPESTSEGGEAMVRYWSDLGFVVPKQTCEGEQVFVETERSPLVGLDARTLFFQLMNVDNHLDCLPAAQDYADHYLAAARALQGERSTPDIWWPFPYSAPALEARLLEIYNDLADNAAYYDPATDPLYRDRDDVIEMLWQWGPFNMTDGAWLRNINRAGPMDEVHALLFSIVCDEMGNGNPARSHANLARDLLHSVGRYPEVVGSEAFAMDRSYLDSAFTVPAFALAISQFTERYLPEIIGMTLFLEWCVLDLKPQVDLLRYYDIDPHFFVLHVGIDNAADGHGHLARKAVEVYLDGVRAEGGEPAVQAHWQRIWNGFVAYGTAGTFGQDLADLLKDRHRQTRHVATERALALIRHKAPFGQLNHGDKMIGANRINDWFRDPQGFLDALVAAGYVVPGEPDKSPFLNLLSFDSGPMFKVFTETEIQVWRDWIQALAPGLPPRRAAPADAMGLLIGHLRERQAGSLAHREVTLAAPGGEGRLPVSEWFRRPTRAFMAALADPANGWIEPGNPHGSAFLADLLGDGNAMGRAFEDVVAGTDDQTGREVVLAWIEAGCPLPLDADAESERPANLWLRSHARVRAGHPTGKILGMGGAH